MLAEEQDLKEIQNMTGEYFSPKFFKIRATYLQELEKINSKEFSEHIITYSLKNTKNNIIKKDILFKRATKYTIRILFPMDEIKKKFRKFGIFRSINSTKCLGRAMVANCDCELFTLWLDSFSK